MINLHEEKISNRKLKSTTNTDGSSKVNRHLYVFINRKIKINFRLM